MRSVHLLLLAGIVSGFLAVAIAVAMGFGFLAIIGFYSLGGMIGLVLTATLVTAARSRSQATVCKD